MAYAAAVSLVPTVDLRDVGATSLAAIDTACRDHGFFLLAGHGYEEVVEQTFEAARRFFGSSSGLKHSVDRDGRNPLGYNDRELTKQRRDRKEVFDFIDPGHPVADGFNRWPELDGFRETMLANYDACSELARRATDLVLAALGLPEPVQAAHRGDRTASSMRLNHYTLGDPVPEHERDGLSDLADVSLGQHTDLGLVTMLLQDDVGGLQAHSAEHGWIDVEPRPGTIVVNLGDCMQVWTNDRYRAALHRVLPMTSTTRMSIPYFLNPDRQCIVEPISGIGGDAPKYRPFPFRQLLDARASDNYADAGAPDAQISDYRIAG